MRLNSKRRTGEVKEEERGTEKGSKERRESGNRGSPADAAWNFVWALHYLVLQLLSLRFPEQFGQSCPVFVSSASMTKFRSSGTLFCTCRKSSCTYSHSCPFRSLRGGLRRFFEDAQASEAPGATFNVYRANDVEKPTDFLRCFFIQVNCFKEIA